MTNAALRWLQELWSVTRRECRFILGDRSTLSILLLAPVLYSLLISLIYWRHTVYDLPLAVVSHDDSQAARTLVRMLESSPKLHVTQRLNSLEEVRQAIMAGSVDAGIIIPSDFSTRLKLGHDVYVTSFINAGSLVPANMATSAINAVVQTFSAGVEIKSLMKTGLSSQVARERAIPVKLDLRPLFNPAYNYTNFLVPGILATVLQQVILLALAGTWAREREEGTLKDLFGLTRHPLAAILGKAIPYTLAAFLSAEFFLRVLFPMNDIPVEAAWYIAMPFTLLFAATIVFWGMWFSALAPNKFMATQALMFIAMPSFLLSGFTWPMSAMPPLGQFLSHMLPITYFVNAFRRLYLSGVPFGLVAREFAILAGFLALNIAISWAAVTRLRRKFAQPASE